MKSLRGSKSEDIIFAGTQSRKSLGFAEASIIIDNQDRKIANRIFRSNSYKKTI